MCLLAWHLGFNSQRKIPYLHDPTNTRHLKRIQMRDGPSFFPEPPSKQHMATQSDLGWLNIPLWFVFWKPSLHYVSIVCMYWAPTKVLDCEKGFEMKYFNSRVVRSASGGTCLWIDMYAYGVDMRVRVFADQYDFIAYDLWDLLSSLILMR